MCTARGYLRTEDPDVWVAGTNTVGIRFGEDLGFRGVDRLILITSHRTDTNTRIEVLHPEFFSILFHGHPDFPVYDLVRICPYEADKQPKLLWSDPARVYYGLAMGQVVFVPDANKFRVVVPDDFYARLGAKEEP